MSLIAFGSAALTWDAEGRAAEVLASSYETLVQNWLLTFFDDSQAAEAQVAYEQLCRLAPQRAKAFMLSPDICAQLAAPLLTHVRPDRKFVEDTLSAELIVAGGDGGGVGMVGDYWTALGDYRISTPQMTVMSHGVTHRQVFIDGESPRHHFDHGEGAQTAYDHESPELEGCYASISRALDAVATRVPICGSFISRWVRSVVIQRTPKDQRFFSGSRATYVGKVAFANSHNATCSNLVEGLVHEAVHSFLYSLELLEPFFLKSRDPGVRITSPWTGRPLPVHSYTHACFVWFALVHFWRKAGTLENAQRQLERATTGFDTVDLVEPLRPYATEAICASIADLHRNVRVLTC